MQAHADRRCLPGSIVEGFLKSGSCEDIERILNWFTTLGVEPCPYPPRSDGGPLGVGGFRLKPRFRIVNQLGNCSSDSSSVVDLSVVGIPVQQRVARTVDACRYHLADVKRVIAYNMRRHHAAIQPGQTIIQDRRTRRGSMRG